MMIVGRRQYDLVAHQDNDLPPARPPQQANMANATGTVSVKPFTRKWFLQLFAIFCVIAGLNVFGAGALLAYDDSLGTPTTATIDRCAPHVVDDFRNGSTDQKVDYQTCDGSWSVGGVSQTGQIRGKFYGDHLLGSRVEVHVRGGTAYQREPRSALNIWFMIGGFVAIVSGVVLFWSVRRRIKTG